MPVDVHVIDARGVEEKMIVEGGYVQAVGEQRGHHWIHFVLCQDEITHHDIHTSGPLRQGDPPAEPERCWRGHTIHNDFEIVARNVHLENGVLVVPLPVE